MSSLVERPSKPDSSRLGGVYWVIKRHGGPFWRLVVRDVSAGWAV